MEGISRGAEGLQDPNVCTLAVPDKSVGKEQPHEEIRSVLLKETDPKRGPTLGTEHEVMLVRGIRRSRDKFVRAPKDKQSQQERLVALGKEQGCSHWGMADLFRGEPRMQLVGNGVSRWVRITIKAAKQEALAKRSSLRKCFGGRIIYPTRQEERSDG
ncbi:hypothetical protein LIER_19073 [Lithospermum erythrorhizon]|uniref:Uncharacterized protein n=1 Tax=Lithospermum erythrorhizon TaxID=34254 RepID=A0AAV3QHY1_LITER